MNDPESAQPGIQATRCTGCGRVSYPERYLCPACGSSELSAALLHHGTVTESTLIRRAPGKADWQPRTIATVRTDEGPVIVVGVDEPIADGAELALISRGAAPYGVPRGH